MKNLIRLAIYICVSVCATSCKKVIETVIESGTHTPKPGEYFTYTIKQGQHYADVNAYQPLQINELKFDVKFDSTAIYQTSDPANQEDINKLYGFADNNSQHHEFSARFGWNWARGSLRLYAYTYNAGVRDSREIIAIQPGFVYPCSIKVTENKYLFTVDHHTIEMARQSTTASAIGYRLYPYFGGDETAPHDITISIKEF